MKLDKILILLALGMSPAALGSIYVSDFTGTNFDDPLTGVDGWSQSIADLPPDGNGDLSPYSWIQRYGSVTNPEKAGAIGTYYASPDTGSSYYVNHSINEPLIGSTLTMDFSITDSTNAYPDRNNFSIALLNSNGTDLFTLNFVPGGANQPGGGSQPDPTDPDGEIAQWDMNWSSNGNAGAEYAGVLEGGDYTYDVTFLGINATDVRAVFTVSGINAPTQTVDLPGLAGETISDLRVSTSVGYASDWGDNFFSFRGVPEPSAAMLVLLSAVGLLRRRR